ncbi:MAG: imidazolonepropionase [Thermoplasmata archaeon]
MNLASEAWSCDNGDSGDLLISNVGQLLTLAGHTKPRTGSALMDLGILNKAAILIEGGLITAVGPQDEVAAEAGDVEALDARGRLVMPGFVDPHTHAAFVGSRERELVDKLAGKSYAQIAREGGGIQRTVRATRGATREQLRVETWHRLRRMIKLGTTTAEIKSGYGLNLEDEIKLLEVISAVNGDLPLNAVPTFLGAHAIPEEYTDPEAYVEHLIHRVLPSVAAKGLAMYCDVFVEGGFFSGDQGRRLLLAGQELGLAAKLHADELTSCGGAELAAEIGAISADHLLFSTEDGLKAMARSGTIAVLLPGTSFTSMGLPYCDARRVIEMDIAVALGTDLSPNSWIESMHFMVSLACYRLGMHPEEAISAATINAAWAVGMAGEVGSLEEGKRGDLLLLNLHDYREIPYRIASNPVDEVVKDGVLLSRG